MASTDPCDDFPLLRKLPDWLSPWRAEALRLHKWEMQLWGGFMDQLKGEREALTSVNSYVNDMLEDRERNGDGFDGKGLGLSEKGLMSDALLACMCLSVFPSAVSFLTLTYVAPLSRQRSYSPGSWFGHGESGGNSLS